MADSSTERRAAELRSLRSTDPAQIIDHYRQISGSVPDGQVGVSFAEMIHAILVHEVRNGKLARSQPQLSE